MDPRFSAAAVLGGLLAVGAVGKFVFEDFSGPSEVVVWAPESQDVQVSLDGTAPVTVRAGGYWVFEAKRGKHEVVSTVGAEKFTIAVDLGSGRWRYAAPVTPHQCFAVAEVTRMYTTGSQYEKAGPPRIESRLQAHQAEKLPKGTFLGATPDSTFRKGELFLVKPFDCDELKVDDRDLLMMMGLT